MANFKVTAVNDEQQIVARAEEGEGKISIVDKELAKEVKVGGVISVDVSVVSAEPEPEEDGEEETPSPSEKPEPLLPAPTPEETHK